MGVGAQLASIAPDESHIRPASSGQSMFRDNEVDRQPNSKLTSPTIWPKRLAKVRQLERTYTRDRAGALPVSGTAGLGPEQEAMCGLLADVARRLIKANIGRRSELKVVD
jgi:hypothetical protein